MTQSQREIHHGTKCPTLRTVGGTRAELIPLFHNLQNNSPVRDKAKKNTFQYWSLGDLC